MAKDNDAGFWGFAKALRRHWWAAMSGGFSVPFTAAGVYFAFVNQNGLAALAFAALAFSAVWLAAYVVWRGEREKVIGLEGRLAASTTTPKPTPDKTVRWAIRYLMALSGDRYEARPRAWDDFREAARLSEITVWGRPNASMSKPREPISAEHWRDYDLDLLTCDQDPKEAHCGTRPDNRKTHNEGGRYLDLMVDERQFQAKWPMSDTEERLRDLRRSGVALRNERVADAVQWADWRSRFDVWRSDVLAVADQISRNLYARLETLDQVRAPPALQWPFHSLEHQNLSGVTSEILQRIEEHQRASS